MAPGKIILKTSSLSVYDLGKEGMEVHVKMLSFVCT